MTLRPGPLVFFILLAAGCRSTFQETSSPSVVTKCAPQLSTSTETFDADGGHGQLAVSTERDCRWTATSDVSWITLAAAGEQQGDATIEFTVARTDAPTSRTGSIVAADQKVEITQRPAACRFQLSVTAAVLPASGGGGDVDVTPSSAACEWTARAEADWVAIKAGRTGRGAGRVTFEAGTHSGPPRATRLAVADQWVTVTQSDACSYTVTPADVALPAGGGAGSASVSAATGCGWSAASGAAWISITGGATGTGAGAIQFAAAANSGTARSATLTIAGRPLVVNQASGCTYMVAPASAPFAAGGGTASVSVTTADGCSWTATSDANWVAIARGAAGAGAGSVQLSAGANAGPERSTLVRIAGQGVTATQANGCTYAISPSGASFTAAGGAGSTTVLAAAGCPWTAASGANWLSLTSGTSGSGPGTVSFAAAPSIFEARTGTLAIAGLTFTASQARGCVVALSASSASFGPDGGTGGFTVSYGCTWRTLVEGGADWVRLTRGDRASGDGPVTFVVAPNPGPARSATLLVEDHDRFTIYQAGR